MPIESAERTGHMAQGARKNVEPFFFDLEPSALSLEPLYHVSDVLCFIAMSWYKNFY
jgi:hypothetical protein